MSKKTVYLGLGGNVGPTQKVLCSALDQIASIKEVFDLSASSLYETTPVSDIPQSSYINMACSFKTTLSPIELFEKLQQITLSFGQGPKPKNAPRTIDIDMLHYEGEKRCCPILELPHPRWAERLFVLVPLYDLTQKIQIPLENGRYLIVDLKEMIENFPNKNHEVVTLLPQRYEPFTSDNNIDIGGLCIGSP